MRFELNWKSAAATACLLFSLAGNSSAAELTGFELIREGNRYVGEQAKDQVVRLRSEKSVGGTTPSIWVVTFHDSTATFKATDVKFGAGKMLDVSRPMKLLVPVTGAAEPLAKDTLKVDSDKALKTALKEPLLARVKVTATSLELSRKKTDGLSVVVWTVKIWAEKTRKPGEDTCLGTVEISAADGKVLKTDLDISKVN
jgi:hypothetical protein